MINKMDRQFSRHWIIITNIILCMYTQQVYLINNDCTADEELNRRLATLTKVYTEALNKKIQEEVEQFCSGIQEDPWIAHILPCDMFGRGWTVIQRRVDGAVDFNRPWIDYVNGFGNAGGNFWIGLEAIYQLTADGPVQLLITLETWEDTGNAVITYSSFRLENSADKYRLRITGYYGTVGDGLAIHNGEQFSTPDQDNDVNPGQCAQLYPGGWWFGSCHHSQLNGIYQNVPRSEYGTGVQWYLYKG